MNLVACLNGDGHRGCVPLVYAQGQDHPKMQKLGDINVKRRATKSRSICAKSIWKVAAAEFAAAIGVSKSYLQRCVQEGRWCNLSLAMTRMQLRLLMYERHPVFCIGLRDAETTL